MKLRVLVLLAIALLAVSACSDDDEGMGDPCLGACNKLDFCGTEVRCSGRELPSSDCIRFCRERQAFSAANCVLEVPQCFPIDPLQACAARMPCS